MHLVSIDVRFKWNRRQNGNKCVEKSGRNPMDDRIYIGYWRQVASVFDHNKDDLRVPPL